MAVLVEAISVIIRAATVDEKYPGGLERFCGECPNSTLCTDGELIRVGFMTPDDVKSFVDHLTANGLTFHTGGSARDFVVADQQRGFTTPCDWAECWRVYLENERKRQVMACRLAGSSQNGLVTPDGWTFEDSLSSQFLFVETGRVPEYLDFVRSEEGVDVYRDIRSGKIVYVGRTKT